MKAGTIIGSLLLASVAGAQVESSKVYTGDDGIEVAVVVYKPGGQRKALVRVTGSGTEFDGKVRLHDIFEEGGGRIAFVGKMRGRDWYTVRGDKGEYRAYLPKRGEVRLKFSDDKSKALKPDTLIAAFDQQTKDGTLAKMEAFDRKGRMAEQEKTLKESAASVDGKCGTKLAVSVDWNTINDETLGQYSVSGFCDNPLDELRRLCETQEGRSFVSSIKKVTCAFGKEMSVKVSGDTLAWTTSTEGYNQDQFVRKELLGPAAPAGGPVWGKLESLQQRIALEQTAVCSDGKSHYVVVAPNRMYWGDDKALAEIPLPAEQGSHNYFFDPRHVNPGANPSFRGMDYRVHSSVEADLAKKTCSVRCGTSSTELKLLAPADAKKLLTSVKIGPSTQKWRPHVLLRDEKGNYYYVDRGFKPGEEKRFRLFKGPKGSLKEQKMTNVVSDSEGEIFSTKTGSLRLIIDRTQSSQWIENNKKTTKLRDVPVGENMSMIYTELGVYSGEKLGNPCDEL